MEVRVNYPQVLSDRRLTMQNIIKRDEYLSRIIDRKENGLIKVITGIRRCGKSFLLFNLFYDYLIESGVKRQIL